MKAMKLQLNSRTTGLLAGLILVVGAVGAQAADARDDIRSQAQAALTELQASHQNAARASSSSTLKQRELLENSEITTNPVIYGDIRNQADEALAEIRLDGLKEVQTSSRAALAQRELLGFGDWLAADEAQGSEGETDQATGAIVTIRIAPLLGIIGSR
jgi:hypothetical protein